MADRLNLVKVVLIIMMLGGIAFSILGVKALVNSRHFLANATAATGTVTDIHRVIQDNEPSYYPIVEFVTLRERVVRFEADESNADLQVGDSIKILYDPANPQEARVDTWFSRWGGAIVMLCVGLGLIIIPAVVYRLLRREKAPPGS